MSFLSGVASCFFFFSSRRRHTRLQGDWSSDVCSSDLLEFEVVTVDILLIYIGKGAEDWAIQENLRAGHGRESWPSKRRTKKRITAMCSAKEKYVHDEGKSGTQILEA